MHATYFFPNLSTYKKKYSDCNGDPLNDRIQRIPGGPLWACTMKGMSEPVSSPECGMECSRYLPNMNTFLLPTKLNICLWHTHNTRCDLSNCGPQKYLIFMSYTILMIYKNDTLLTMSERVLFVSELVMLYTLQRTGADDKYNYTSNHTCGG